MSNLFVKIEIVTWLDPLGFEQINKILVQETPMRNELSEQFWQLMFFESGKETLKLNISKMQQNELSCYCRSNLIH